MSVDCVISKGFADLVLISADDCLVLPVTQAREQLAVGNQLPIPFWQNLKQSSVPLPRHVELLQEMQVT